MDKIVFIDANIFLEIALGDINSEKCSVLLNKIMRGEIKAYTSDFIVYACLLQMQYKTKDTKQMKNFVIFINSIENLTILRPSLYDIGKAVEIAEKSKLDYGDSLVVSCMMSNNIKTLISQDKDFNKIETIIRKDP